MLYAVTFDDVRQSSRILPDLTVSAPAADTVEVIATKLATVVLVNDNPDSLPA